jgi:hypothetical protein
VDYLGVGNILVEEVVGAVAHRDNHVHNVDHFDIDQEVYEIVVVVIAVVDHTNHEEGDNPEPFDDHDTHGVRDNIHQVLVDTQQSYHQ